MGSKLESSALRTYRILVVDDEPGIRYLLRRVLAAQGYDVTVAADGAEALLMFKTASFDLVITDLTMPNVDGIQLLRILRTRPSPPRVIAMSGGRREDCGSDLDVATTLGAAATLAKPFTLQDCSTAMKRALAAPG